jgi:hypothetical protein
MVHFLFKLARSSRSFLKPLASETLYLLLLCPAMMQLIGEGNVVIGRPSQPLWPARVKVKSLSVWSD